MQNQQQEFTFSENREQAFDVKAFLWGYLRYWYWFFFALAICGLGAWLYLRYTVPEYQAYGKLLIKDGKSDQLVSEEALLQDLGLLSGSSNLVNEMEILKSRSLMQKVVDKLGIAVRYYAVGRFKDTELFGNLPLMVDTAGVDLARLAGLSFQVEAIGENSFRIKKGEEALGDYEFGEFILIDNLRFRILKGTSNQEKYNYPIAIEFTNPESTARSYANKLGIRTVRDRASVLELSLVDYSGTKAAAILNELVEVYNQATIDDKNRVAKNTLKFIGERLEFLTLELAEVEGDVERYKSRNNIALELEGRAQDVLTRVNQYEQEIAEQEIQLELANDLLQKIRDTESPFALLPISLNENNSELNQEIEQYNQLIIQHDQLVQSAGVQNPLLLNLEGQINDLRQNIIGNLQTYTLSLKLGKERIATKYADLRNTLSKIPQAERELLEKKRQQIIKENLFLYLLQKREETALSLAVAVPNSRVVDPAEASASPIAPVAFNIMALAVFLGLSLPIGGILLKQILDDKIRGEKDLKDFSAVPIIGAIAESDSENEIVVTPQSRTSVAEMFRLIRTNLRFMTEDQQTPTLLVTSSAGGEGKTFISINLGMSMAISNKRTLIIGLDLRKPKLGSYLQEEDTSFGITNYIIDETLSPEQVIRQSSVHNNLHFVTSGPIPPNPAELMMTDRMGQFMEYAQQAFDFVIIDTPPVGLVADAFLLNKYISNSLYVLRVGKTRKQAVAFIDDIYQQQKLKNLSCVLNGTPSGGDYGYNYGYGGYGGNYGYGYYDEDKGKKWWKFWG